MREREIVIRGTELDFCAKELVEFLIGPRPAVGEFAPGWETDEGQLVADTTRTNAVIQNSI